MSTIETVKCSCVEAAHQEHLCHLQYEGYHLTQRNAYKQLVWTPEYICESCGRTAGSELNLCHPAGL